MAKIVRPTCLMVVLALILSLGVAIFGVSSVVTADTGGPDDFGYRYRDSDEPDGPTYNWIEISGSGTLAADVRDDDEYENVPIGFDFEFYGDTHSDVYVTSNGILTFDLDNATAYENDVGIPYSDEGNDPNDMIAPFWDDLDPVAGGDVSYETQGSAPNRQFIVQWHDIKHYVE